MKNTIVKTIRDSKHDFIEAEIGDSKQDDFFPQVKLKRLSNEYNLSVRYKHNGKGNGTHEEKEGKIIWKSGKEEAHIYPIEDGYEIEAVLNEKPKSNVIEFTLQTKGIKFYYQPELTEEEKKKGHERPENVVGSYAVYAEKVKKTYKGSKEYGVGKIGHIYRPKCTDATGKEVWAALDIHGELLSVTVPQEFLDTAVYPVIVDPTIGYSTAGGSQLYGYNNMPAVCSLFNTITAETGDVVSSIQCYAKKDSSDETIAMSLYRIESGTPTTKTGTEASVNVNSTTAQWWSYAVNDTLTNGYEYGVAYGGWSGADIASASTKIYYDFAGSNNISTREYTEQSLPATWDQYSLDDNIMSLYATFTRLPVDMNYTYTIFIDKANP